MPKYFRDRRMRRKSKPKMSKVDVAKDLWINPRSNIKGPDGDRAWDNQGNISPNSGAKFLELADIALGLKKPTTPRKKKAAAAGAHRPANETET